MAKVITSTGLNDFIETGKTEKMEKPKEPAKEPANEEAKADAKAEAKVETKADSDPDGNNMPEDTIENLRLKVNKKHRALEAEKALRMRLQEERDENERLAESQYNQRRLVESERDRLSREVEELKLRATPQQAAPELKAPDKDDPKFKDDKGQFQWDKFTDAQAEYRVEQFKAEQKNQADAISRAALETAVRERIEVAKTKYPDFIEVVSADERKDVPPYIMQFMAESEQGADIAYYFGKNREELTKISKLSPIMALARLGKLETRFEPKAEDKSEKVETKVEPKADVRTSSAPPPITPISGQGSGTVNTDPGKMSFKELRAYEREKNKRKG
jgi:hypothetical protein